MTGGLQRSISTSVPKRSRGSIRTASYSPIYSFHSAQHIRMAASKRKFSAQDRVGAKRAKTAAKYATATQPSVQEDTTLQTLLSSLHFHQHIVKPSNGHVVNWFRGN